MTEQEPLVSIRNLRVNFNTYQGVVKVLNGIDLDIHEREVIGLVGETGCGKSVTSLAILRLIDYPGEIVEGEVWFQGNNLLELSEEEMRDIRGNRIAMIFQDPTTYLNPVFNIGDQIAEAIALHQRHLFVGREAERSSPFRRSGFDQAVKERVIQVLQLVRMPDPEKVMRQYPHELSGGMKQRCMIAIGLSCNPDLLIADEATTNLDVTIQAKVLDLMVALRAETGASMVMITHDMGVVAETCDRVAVMYAGDIVEEADVISLFDRPSHPYTMGLLEAIPKLHYEEDEELRTIRGTVPNLIDPPPGCRFHPRCLHATEICQQEKPRRTRLGPSHFVACHHVHEIHRT